MMTHESNPSASSDPMTWIDRREESARDQPSPPPTMFSPARGPRVAPGTLLLDALPDLLHAVGVMRAQADWLADSLEDQGTARAPDSARGLARHAAQVETAMGTLAALAAASSAPTMREGVDPNALFSPIVAMRRATRPETLDYLCEMPVCATDPALLRAIFASLLDAGLGAARRAGDVIGLRAIRSGQTLRLTVVFPGPPIAGEAREEIFSGRPSAAILPPTALALSMLWVAVAAIEGQIEVGDGPRGNGARITVILPYMASRAG